MQVLKSMLLWLRRDRAAVSIAKTHKISNENIVDLQTVCTHLYIFNNNFVVVVVRLGLFSFRTTVFTKMKRPQATQKIKKIKHSLLTVVLEAVDKLKMVHAWLLKTFHSTVQHVQMVLDIQFAGTNCSGHCREFQEQLIDKNGCVCK